ncbi:hypothetical protein NEOLEDRAFT_1241017 [Neolentinus lepideus HHB14362 ss-1]|uniref:Uncharacterized protein n=1 Tax=Neolentinus lepideus HHB14362 ss-1 TaxID=1314782 RepID=A0A165TES4_9AGAM|nr:hypothetical protein NEOLEDRAFT_1241017 [Neolentinus lepideus HHB14362 ss-1]
MAASGMAQNLNVGMGQVLQAFLDSLSSEGPGQSANGGEFTPEQVERLSNKLGEILGDIEQKSEGRKNEKGELVNEEGLPIVDINEPIQSTSELSTQSMPYEESDLLPLWVLGPAERERRQREQDRILNLLEEEERIEYERDADREHNQRREELERRKEAAKADLEKLKAARELQKKMGKALLRNMAQSKEREEREKQRQEEEDNRLLEEKKKAATLRPRKSVTFADKPDHNAEESKRLTPILSTSDLGDVTLAKLHTPRPGLPTARELDTGIMKMNVVERLPTGPRSPPPIGNRADVSSDADSDDESVLGSPVPADSDEGDIINSDVEESGSSEEEVVLDEEYDMDTVQHHREIALAYYEKRSTIGVEAKKAMTLHTHDSELDWDQPEVPLEATLASPPPKPSISRFKADRTNTNNFSRPETASTSASTSLGALTIPASQTRRLQRAVRTGRMENGKLIGGEDGDSSSDIDADEHAREVLEMLKRGEVVNAGPDAACSNLEDQLSVHQRNDPGPSSQSAKAKPQTSKFKSAFAAAQIKTPTVPTVIPMTPATPINNVGRSSPKMSAVSSIVERQAPSASRLLASLGRNASEPKSSSATTDPGLSVAAHEPLHSPLLPTMNHAARSTRAGSLPPIIDSSPSQPLSSAALGVMPSMIVESPPFPVTSPSSRPDRPLAVMSEQVRESTGSPKQAEPANTEVPKVSRFLAQRSGRSMPR